VNTAIAVKAGFSGAPRHQIGHREQILHAAQRHTWRLYSLFSIRFQIGGAKHTLALSGDTTSNKLIDFLFEVLTNLFGEIA